MTYFCLLIKKSGMCTSLLLFISKVIQRRLLKSITEGERFHKVLKGTDILRW